MNLRQQYPPDVASSRPVYIWAQRGQLSRLGKVSPALCSFESRPINQERIHKFSHILKIHTQLSGFAESNQEEKCVINLSIIHPLTSKLFILIYSSKPRDMNSNYCNYSVISAEIGLLF